MNRNGRLALSLVTLLFLGLIYGWSIFVGPLEAEFGWTRAETSLTFTICVSANILGGFLSTALGEGFPGGNRGRLLLGGALILCGFSCVSLWPSLFSFYLFYGVLCGAGIGIAYMALAAAIPPLFPERLGLVSGLLFMAYGTGSLLLGPVCSQMLAALGWRVTFRALGVAFAALLALCAAFVGGEGANGRANGGSTTPAASRGIGDLARDPRLWGTILWSLLSATAGLSVTGQIVPCAELIGVPAGWAVIVGGAVSLGNGLGRVLCGLVLDRWGLARTLPLATAALLLGAVVATVGYLAPLVPAFVLGVVLLGVSFGIAPTLSAFSAREFFGMDNYAKALGLTNLQVIAASVVGPWLSGVLFTATGSYAPMFWEIVALGLAAVPACAWQLHNVRRATNAE